MTRSCCPLVALLVAVSPAAVGAQPTTCAETPEGVLPEPNVLDAARDAYDHEPSVRDVVTAALETLETTPEEVRRARRRGRRSGLMPTLRTGLTRNRGIDLDEYQDGNPTDVAIDASLRIDAQLTFELGRLVYGPDEIAWNRELRAIVSLRESRIRDVVELYFRRRRLQIERDFLCDCSLENAMEIESIEALLDVFTAGVFSRIIAEAQESPDARATSAHTPCRSSERRGLER